MTSKLWQALEGQSHFRAFGRGTSILFTATEPYGQETPMDGYGCVHLVMGEEQARDWYGVLNRNGWNAVIYSATDQLWRSSSPRMMECVVLDLDMVPMTTVQRFANYPAASPILTAATPASLDLAIESVRSGAWDVLLKPISSERLIAKISAALVHDRQAKERNHDWQSRCDLLSPREREVLDLLLGAYNAVQIARRLGISPKTAEKHRLHVLEKLNLQSVAELLRLAFGPRSLVQEVPITGTTAPANARASPGAALPHDFPLLGSMAENPPTAPMSYAF